MTYRDRVNANEKRRFWMPAWMPAQEHLKWQLRTMETTQEFSVENARHNRKSQGTRTGYRSNINQILLWAASNDRYDILRRTQGHEYTDANSSGIDPRKAFEINLDTFSHHDFLEFIMWSCNNKTIAIGTLQGYRSAIKSLYKDKKIPLPDEYGDDIKEVFSGTKSSLYRLILL